MTSHRIAKAKSLYNKVDGEISELTNLVGTDQNTLLAAIHEVQLNLVRYSKLVDQIIDIGSPVRTNSLIRKRTLLEISLKSAVEKLGFDYETDILFAESLTQAIASLSLEDDNPEDSLNLTGEQEDLETMSNFDMKLAMTSIEKFTGLPENLIDFIGTCECFNRMLNEAGQATFLDFVINFKLPSKVKNRLTTQTFNSLNQLCKELSSRFADKTTEEEKMNQLEKIYQKQSVREYADKVENLAADLLRLKMAGEQETSRTIINSGIQKLAVRHFIRGLKRTEVKQALIYKQPADLTEAIKFALEADARFFENNQGYPINYFNARFQGQNNYSRNRNYNNNNYNYNNNDYNTDRRYNSSNNNQLNFNNSNDRNLDRNFQNRNFSNNYQYHRNSQFSQNGQRSQNYSQNNRNPPDTNSNLAQGSNSNYRQDQGNRDSRPRGRNNSNVANRNYNARSFNNSRNVNHFQQQPFEDDFQEFDNSYVNDSNQGNVTDPHQTGGSRLGDIRD